MIAQRASDAPHAFGYEAKSGTSPHAVANLELARRYLAAIESGEDLAYSLLLYL
jgi:hypothetical protein